MVEPSFLALTTTPSMTGSVAGETFAAGRAAGLAVAGEPRRPCRRARRRIGPAPEARGRAGTEPRHSLPSKQAMRFVFAWRFPLDLRSLNLWNSEHRRLRRQDRSR